MTGKVKVHIGRIPRSCTGVELVDLLEKAVGKGTIYSANIVADPQTCDSKGFGFVVFHSEKAAERAAMLGENGHLVLLNSPLQVNLAERDIVKRPRHSVTTWDHGKLYLSSLISETTASWQWSSSSNLTTDFDFQSRKVQFLVDVMPSSGNKQHYKMESEFEEIESVKLVAVLGAPSRALLYQLRTPPHIYVKQAITSTSRDFLSDLFSTTPRIDPYNIHTEEEELWIRTTDFTPKKSIAQCFTYIVELSTATTGDDMNDLFRKFADFKLASHPPLIQQVSLEKGLSFASTQVLVPIVRPPEDVKMEFDLVFRVNQLVQTSKLIGETLDSSFYELLQRHGARSKVVLENMAKRGTACYNPVAAFEEELASLEEAKRDAEKLKSGSLNAVSIKLAPGLIWVRRVLVTPTKIYCTGPEVDTSNRVTRHYSNYADRFMRVSFVDENLAPLMSTALSIPTRGGAQAGVDAKRSPLYDRILAVLKEGFLIGSYKFEFLAFSSSQLREQSVWMFASDGNLTAGMIRDWMGDFLHIRNVAKCAARMGQCFSSSTQTLAVQPHEIELIPDIEREDEFGMSKYCFSDGIGKISKEFAAEVAKKYNDKKLQPGAIPSAFQIRYGGYKGVVAVDPSSKAKLSLRPSMRKFTSTHVGLDVLTSSRFLPAYLNRQIIMLLSTLGVADEVFERMQQRLVAKLDEMMTDAAVARDLLQVNHSGGMHSRLISLLAAGYHPQREPFVHMLLHAFRSSQLLELRQRTRILQPKGRVLLGTLDETQALAYGEIYLRVTPAPGRRYGLQDGLQEFDAYPLGNVYGKEDNVGYVVTGWVVVAKNPCLHPGDVRKLRAVDVPELRHMVDCLVFPQKGHRPHPNECSGSDLDGDLYFVSWDEELIPPNTDEPMDYTSPGTVNLDHAVTIEEIQEFFVKYMVNDSLGVISNAHVVHADTQPTKARSYECQELAKLVSIAVDFPKTGVPAIIPHNLRPKTYPDFMEKEQSNHNKPTYQSRNVLGKLFRQITLTPSSQTLALAPPSHQSLVAAFDADLVVPGYEDYLEMAKFYKNVYDRKLIGLMNQYGIETEAEAVSGNVVKLGRQHVKRRFDVVERVREGVESLVAEARGWFERNDDADADELVDDDVFAKASAWYRAGYHPSEGAKGGNKLALVSFPWVVCDVLLEIKRAAQAG